MKHVPDQWWCWECDKFVHVGDVCVWRGEPPNNNPHGPSLMGNEREAALRSFVDPMANNVVWDEDGRRRQIVPLTEYTFWHVPCTGPTHKWTSREIHVESTKIDPTEESEIEEQPGSRCSEACGWCGRCS